MPQLGTNWTSLTLRGQDSGPRPFHTITAALRFQVRQHTHSSLASKGLGLREHPTHLSSSAAPLA